MTDAVYQACLDEATTRLAKGTLKLCPEGYCTVKQQAGQWSAYKSLQAARICSGHARDFRGERRKRRGARGGPPSDLRRWVEEDWRNTCEPDADAPCGYKACGTGEGHEHPQHYPYCRPCKRVRADTPLTIGELDSELLQEMCRSKRKAEREAPGASPTRVYVSERDLVRVPDDVKEAAQLAMKLRADGAHGGRGQGWARAAQLSREEFVDAKTLRDMRTWFARHGPDAKNGGTSYGAPTDDRPSPRGYCRYLTDHTVNRGAVAWLLWGGSPAYRWLKGAEVRDLLQRMFPRSKRASSDVYLPCDAPPRTRSTTPEKERASSTPGK